MNIKELEQECQKKPLIALYDNILSSENENERYAKVQLICYYIAVNGGIPVLVPRDADVTQIALNIDGYALPGGGDIDPKVYGKEKHPKTIIEEDNEKERFALENCFVRNAVKTGKPLLAFCRGMQVVNVILGKIWQEEHSEEKLGERGTLIQHLPDIFPDDDVHTLAGKSDMKAEDVVIWQEKLNRGEKCGSHPVPSSHDIRIIKGSKLAKIIGLEQVGCYSSHHQAVGSDTIAPQLTPCAYSVKKDGTLNMGFVEAAEYKNILIIQSHSESGLGNIANALFKNLVEKALEYQNTNKPKKNLDIVLPYCDAAAKVVTKICL
ncbi:MAG: gamma-glutamyl-gamma-aminobutyrate hydrolase family protein [Alphaproteobacteria bacterium]